MLDLKLEYEYMKEDIDSAVKKCLEHQKWILGPEVKELEDRIAEYLNVKHCIGVCSGTEALVLSLRALAIKLKDQEYFDRTDEIITTPFTFTATGDAILRSGATPVFVDIDPSDFNIDVNKINDYLAQSLTSKVVGIVPVHLYGHACNMDVIMKIAEKHNVFIVEDVAQAFGGMYKNRRLGSIGTTGTFSFFPSKNLGGFGDGGVIATNDDKIAELVRMLLRHGGNDKYNVDHIGYNARLDTIHAAIVMAKLKYIDEFNEKRRRVADAYTEGLKNIEGIVLPKFLLGAYHVYNQYTVRVSNGKRNELQRYLKERGISSMVYYPFPLHKMKVFNKGMSKSYGDLDHTNQATKSVVSLPIEPLQSTEETSYIINCIKEYFKS